jgi:hypothetical protein
VVEGRTEVTKTPVPPGEEERGLRHAARFSTRLMAGAALGCVLGLVLGLTAGSIWFRSSSAVIACVVSGVIGLGGLGAFIGGMAGLESPDPTNEPSQSEEPLSDPAVSVERSPNVGTPPTSER